VQDPLAPALAQPFNVSDCKVKKSSKAVLCAHLRHFTISAIRMHAIEQNITQLNVKCHKFIIAIYEIME
jgi:hypothetical protein